jgi:hypothetical protein
LLLVNFRELTLGVKFSRLTEKSPKRRKPLAPINTNTLHVKGVKTDAQKSENRKGRPVLQKTTEVDLAHEDPPVPFRDENLEALNISKYLGQIAPILPTRYHLTESSVIFEPEDLTETPLMEDPVTYTPPVLSELTFDD